LLSNKVIVCLKISEFLKKEDNFQIKYYIILSIILYKEKSIFEYCKGLCIEEKKILLKLISTKIIITITKG
jgi:hypothetical protein